LQDVVGIIIGILPDLLNVASLLNRLVKKKKLERQLKKLSKKKDIDLKEFIVSDIDEFLDTYIDGTLGDKLFSILRKYYETNDPRIIEEFSKAHQEGVNVIVGVARRLDELKIMLGKEMHYYLHIPKTLSIEEMKIVALATYRLIKIINAIGGGVEIRLYLATPLAVSFLLGQMLGVKKYNVVFMQYQDGKYYEVPQIRPDEL